MKITPIYVPPINKHVSGQYTKEYANQSHFAQVLAQTIKQTNGGKTK